MTDVIEGVARRRHNYERARAFGAPVLRSLHPDAILVGYSILGHERPPSESRDRMVEANHVVRSSLETPRPLAFTTRTWKFGPNLELDFLLHAVDHLRNGDPAVAALPATKADRDAVLRSLEDADWREVEVRIDDVIRRGIGADLRGSRFVKLIGEGAPMMSIAAPVEFVQADFSSSIPE